jgi:hypothetical protein
MHARRLITNFIASLSILAIAGCGASPTQLPRTVSNMSMGARATKPAPAAPAGQDDQDIGKNPFIIWIKQTHPQEAAAIIDQYMSSQQTTTASPAGEGDRQLLRSQAIGQVCNELLKNVKMGLPQGLLAKVAEPGHVRIYGYQKQFGFTINLQFDFVVTMDKAGMIWIKTPKELVKASADSAVLRMLAGNLNDKVYDELIKQVDQQGPPNVRKTPGLSYTKGGTFRVDPGFAFVNQPA